MRNWLFVVVFLYSGLGFAAQTVRRTGAECAIELNRLVSERMDLNPPLTLPWIGGNRGSSMKFGWARLALPSFDQMLDRIGVSPDLLAKVKQSIFSLQVPSAEAVNMDRQHPQILTSRLVKIFIEMNKQNRELHAAFVPARLSDHFPIPSHTYFIEGAANFVFVDDRECNGHALTTCRGVRLHRPMEALLLKQPNEINEHGMNWWVADFLAGLSRWVDLDRISSSIGRASYGQINLDGVVSLDDNGAVLLSSTYWGAYVEARAEAVRAWVLHQLNGMDWDASWGQVNSRTLAWLETYTNDDNLAHYLQLANGIFTDHAIPLDEYLHP